MTNAKPIENWSFLYVRLQGTADYRGKVQAITTSVVVMID